MTGGALFEAQQRLHELAASLLPYPTTVGSYEIDGKSIAYIIVDKAPAYLAPIATSTGELYRRAGASSKKTSIAEVVTAPDNKYRPVQIDSPTVRVFVAMSFREEKEPALVDYFAAIQRAAAATLLPLKVVRIDLVEGDFEISQEIMNQIDSCDIVVADFTLTPPNVYFEIGYARGSKTKEIIQIARQDTTLEFDARNWRTDFYRNATALEAKMRPRLEAAYRKVAAKE